MLLQDEQYVVKWLSQYGALPKTQITRMLQKLAQTADKILRNLKKQMRIADVSSGYYIGWMRWINGSANHSCRMGSSEIH